MCFTAGDLHWSSERLCTCSLAQWAEEFGIVRVVCLGTRDLPSVLQPPALSSLSKLLNDPLTGSVPSCSVPRDSCTSPFQLDGTTTGLVNPGGLGENKLSLTVLLGGESTKKHIPVFWDRDIQTHRFTQRMCQSDCLTRQYNCILGTAPRFSMSRWCSGVKYPQC